MGGGGRGAVIHLNTMPSHMSLHALTRFPPSFTQTQTRNQVLEESPSVLLRPETRRAMQQQAAMLARAVKYRWVLVHISVVFHV